jgi:hypothetical protein
VAKAQAAESAPAVGYDAAAAAVKLDPDEAGDLDEGDLDEPMPEPPPPPPAAPVAEMRAELPPSSTQTGIDPINAPSALPMGTLQVLSGGFAGRELELTKALTTLGRPGIQVAAVTRRKEGYYIVHVESGKEGDFPLVNGDPIGAQAKKLTDNDVVQLAGVKMGFYLS